MYSKQSGFKVSKYTHIYTHTYEEADEEKAEEVRGRRFAIHEGERKKRVCYLYVVAILQTITKTHSVLAILIQNGEKEHKCLN